MNYYTMSTIEKSKCDMPDVVAGYNDALMVYCSFEGVTKADVTKIDPLEYHLHEDLPARVTVDHVAHHHHMNTISALPSFEGLTIRTALRRLRRMIHDGDFGDLGGMELSLTDGTILEVENTPEHLMGAQRIRRADHHHETIRWYKV